MTSIARFIAGHWLISVTVGLVVTVLALGTGLVLSDAGDIATSDRLSQIVYVVGGSLGFTLVGATILVQRPGHRIGRLMMVMGVTFGLSHGGPLIIAAVDPTRFGSGSIPEGVVAFSEGIGFLTIVLGAVLLIIWFPDGRTTSRLGTMVQASVVVITVLELVRLVDPTVFGESELGFVVLIGAYAAALVDLIVRYRRSDDMRRTQIRWVLASGSVTTSLIVALLAFGDRIEWLWQAWLLSTTLPAIAVGIAVTRYHLYEIDRIISRTLTYAGVTITLFGVFVAANLVAQWALSPFTGGNAIAVAGSTLVAAAAFNPIRSRLQAVVDRRFNRGRYDAERTIDLFAGRLREELDLTTLSAALQATSRAAVEPVDSAIWLRGGPRR